MAVPGVAPPVVWQGDLLVDGAVVNSLPTDVMQTLERGPIIASDVSTEGALSLPGVEGPDIDAILRWSPLESGLGAGAGKRPSLISILFRTATLTSESSWSVRSPTLFTRAAVDTSASSVSWVKSMLTPDIAIP